MRKFLAFIAIPLLLNGCASAVISAGAEVAETAAENRTAGRKVDDKILYANVYNQYSKADRADLISKVNLNTRFARLMLTGRVLSEADAQTAAELAWKAEGVEEVINELVVDPNRSNWTTANDSMVKRNLEARLFITKDVWVINYSLDIQNGVAYIIGRVRDQAELDRVLTVCRTTKGVKRVVSHLQISTEREKPTPPPGGAANNVDALQSKPNAAPVYVPSTQPLPYQPIPQDSTRRVD